MLVSHRYQFVYTKTVKTAGTSVEAYFEPYCLPEDFDYVFAHSRDELVTDAGIIGYRGANASHAQWYNHMPAARIRALIGRDTWDRYLKFCVVRDPFEKLVSGFYMFRKRTPPRTPAGKAKAVAQKWLRRGFPPSLLTDGTPIDQFREWVRLGGRVDDRDKYLIRGSECIDVFIRYEQLQDGIRDVCERLRLPYTPDRLPVLKPRQSYGGPIGYAEHYDADTIARVSQLYRYEIDRFGYAPPAVCD